jgi:hypothetical protein
MKLQEFSHFYHMRDLPIFMACRKKSGKNSKTPLCASFSFTPTASSRTERRTSPFRQIPHIGSPNIPKPITRQMPPNGACSLHVESGIINIFRGE